MTDDKPTADDYLNPSGGSLLDRVDFGGMLKDLAGGTVVAMFTFIVGPAIALKESVGGLVGDIYSAGGNIKTTLLSSVSGVQGAAVGEAVSEIGALGALAGPVSTAVVLVAISIALYIVYLFLWGDS